jgi:peptide/nickel transport system substrate-binding protein
LSTRFSKWALLVLVGLLCLALVAFPACTAEPTGEQQEEEEEERTTGPYLDEVIITEEPNYAQAVYRLQTDDLDMFAYGLADADLFTEVVGDSSLVYTQSVGSFDELTLNPVGPTFPTTGKLNPFSVPEFREALNWLIDRDYICDEILGGLGVPRYTAIGTASVDYIVRFPSDIHAIEAEYAYNPTQAEAAIESVMTGLGATKTDGQWMYGGEQVELLGLIRTEDERLQIGDYVADLYEDLGFKVTRTYGISSALSPFWLGDPSLGTWHFYTGGWVSTTISLDESYNFGDFYTPLGWPGNALWEAYDPDPAFFDAAEALYNSEFTTMGERGDLVKTCLDMSLEDSARVFVLDEASFSPMQKDVRVAADKAGGIYGSWMWAFTSHFVDSNGDPIIGGSMRIGTGGILTQPFNPVAGSNWVYDMFPIRATGDLDTQPDTQTGLRWPGRAEKAEVTVVEGKPIEVANTDWCTLTFVPEIQVPLDAWSDWDAANQEFLTCQDRFGSGGTTCARKTVEYFPTDIFDTPLHDGSTLSVGDFIMRAIIEFDRSDPASAIYDPATVTAHETFMSAFKGVKYITDDPNYGLIIEYYTDQCPLNAELAAYYEETRVLGWPEYDQGPGMWHTVGLGVMAEADGELAFSQDKADDNEIEWTSMIAGPSIPILKSKLDEALSSVYIPYEPTMGDFVTAAEAAERWNNLSNFYDQYKHFWVASGPFFLYKAFTTEKVIQLKRFEDYPDPIGQWDFLIDM